MRRWQLQQDQVVISAAAVRGGGSFAPSGRCEEQAETNQQTINKGRLAMCAAAAAAHTRTRTRTGAHNALCCSEESSPPGGRMSRATVDGWRNVFDVCDEKRKRLMSFASGSFT